MGDESHKITLDEWERAVLPHLRELEFKPAPVRNVTLLAYFFWDDDRIESKFYTIECTFLSAFRSFGLAPSVLVVNRTTARMLEFVRKFNIELQVDPTLTGGVPRMNIDCVSRLHSRFATDYVAIIQSDGIIVNPGLERFVGEYDYIGAPWTSGVEAPFYAQRRWFPIGNGGLCLRSRRICEAAAKAYNRFWRHLPYNWFVSDDVFYSKTMPFLSASWRRTFRYPDIATAAAFSIESHFAGGKVPPVPPVGFHANNGFNKYVESFGLPHSDLI